MPSLSSVYHRLTKLELLRFGGNILDWQSFWDFYESAIHTNISLSDVQKLISLDHRTDEKLYRLYIVGTA